MYEKSFGFCNYPGPFFRVLSLAASVGLYVRVCQSRACPHDNSSLIQVRIIKFGPEMQNTLVRSLLFLGMIDRDLQGQI